MRSDAYIRVSCDVKNCDESEEIQLTATAGGGYDERDVDDRLRRAEWKKDGERDICPGCVEDINKAADEEQVED